MKVYVYENPRSLALVSEKYALVFRYATPTDDKNRPRCIVEFAPIEKLDFRKHRALSPLDCHGFLGLINIASDVFLCVITAKSLVASPRPGETINRVHGVEFHCLNRNTWDFVTLDLNGYPIDLHDQGSGSTISEHPCTQLRKMLTNSSFYYSTDFDLTSSMQTRGTAQQASARNPAGQVVSTLESTDASFLWNAYMMTELVKFRDNLPDFERAELDKCGFLTTLIRGFAETVNTRIGNFDENSISCRLTIISKLSCRMAGTRFLARGIDDDGFVANFVETETILYTERKEQEQNAQVCCAFLQVRGSVPFFWEQDSQLLSNKVQITRSIDAAQPAFERHMDYLCNKYGSIHVINLLSREKSHENELTQRYHGHIRKLNEAGGSHSTDPDSGTSRGGLVTVTDFDFHHEVSKQGYSAATRVLNRVIDAMEEYGYYSEDSSNPNVTLQNGVFRTNCLDCLDRTNMIQQVLSRQALQIFLDRSHMGCNPDFWSKHNILWADNGDQLSQIYAGTNALKTSYTRSGKMNLAGAIADVGKSVGRLYINNFTDKTKQNTTDVLLGRLSDQDGILLYDPINDFVIQELDRRKLEFSSTTNIKVFAGTFNLNGELSDADLTGWFFPPKSPRELSGGAGFDVHADLPSIVLVGFQEIVQLTPGQILNADPGKKEFWEKRVEAVLNKRDEYVLLRSHQLVGTALLLFVRKAEVGFVKNIEGAVKKTGLGGMAGNKGGVAVSFSYANTRFCFITAHLAAGTSNIEERHHDFKTLNTGLRFSRGLTIKDHDCVIWLGDFNYRIDMDGDMVRQIIAKREYGLLFEHDQLNRQMVLGETFPYYNEMEIHFPPTYKFDNGTATYDTSEKFRTPSWTDRVLYKGAGLRGINYGCDSDLLFSDHRPVYAEFNAQILIVDQKRKAALGKELYDKRRSEMGGNNNLISLSDFNEVTLTHGLPPPSTDARKWWISGGQTAKVPIVPPSKNMILNPRKINPFEGDKPDFVEKPALPPRRKPLGSPPVRPVVSNPGTVPKPGPKPSSLRSGSHSSQVSATAPVLPVPELSQTSLLDMPIGPSASSNSNSSKSLLD